MSWVGPDIQYMCLDILGEKGHVPNTLAVGHIMIFSVCGYQVRVAKGVHLPPLHLACYSIGLLCMYIQL